MNDEITSCVRSDISRAQFLSFSSGSGQWYLASQPIP